jgi:hypothetical protein
MDIGNHGSDVTRAVGGFGSRGVLDGVEVGGHRRMEVHRISFVEGVDLAPWGDGDLQTVRSVKG